MVRGQNKIKYREPRQPPSRNRKAVSAQRFDRLSPPDIGAFPSFPDFPQPERPLQKEEQPAAQIIREMFAQAEQLLAEAAKWVR